MRAAAALLLLLLPAAVAAARLPVISGTVNLRDVRVIQAGSLADRARGPAALPQRISAELREVTVREAAETLGSLIGVGVDVPAPPTAREDGLPVLDYERRATLSWKDAPLAQALREFCAAYGCSLARDYRGSYNVLPEPLPSGPELKLEGFVLSVRRIQFGDYRSTGEAPDDNQTRRALHLEFGLRAVDAEMASLYGLNHVRVVDQSGRDRLDPSDPALNPTPAGRTEIGPFPDERIQRVVLEWPYPTPHRLRKIEGDLVLYQAVRRRKVVVPIPAANERPETIRTQELQFGYSQVSHGPESFQALVQVVHPPTAELLLSGSAPPVTLELEDGTTATARTLINSWGFSEGVLTGYVTVNAGRLPSRPVRMVWDVAFRSQVTRKVRFQWESYPAILGPAPAPAAKRAEAGL
ncbi:MAG: hypothetical protein ACK47B_08395 [Armatimonadota bacterium]